MRERIGSFPVRWGDSGGGGGGGGLLVGLLAETLQRFGSSTVDVYDPSGGALGSATGRTVDVVDLGKLPTGITLPVGELVYAERRGRNYVIQTDEYYLLPGTIAAPVSPGEQGTVVLERSLGTIEPWNRWSLTTLRQGGATGSAKPCWVRWVKSGSSGEWRIVSAECDHA